MNATPKAVLIMCPVLLACARFYLPTPPACILQSITFADIYTKIRVPHIHIMGIYEVNACMHTNTNSTMCAICTLLIHRVHTNRCWHASQAIKMEYIIPYLSTNQTVYDPLLEYTHIVAQHEITTTKRPFEGTMRI